MARVTEGQPALARGCRTLPAPGQLLPTNLMITNLLCGAGVRIGVPATIINNNARLYREDSKLFRIAKYNGLSILTACLPDGRKVIGAPPKSTPRPRCAQFQNPGRGVMDAPDSPARACRAAATGPEIPPPSGRPPPSPSPDRRRSGPHGSPPPPPPPAALRPGPAT